LKLTGATVLAIANKVDMNAGTLRNAAALSRRAVIKAGFCTVAALPLAGCWGDGAVVKRIKVIAKAEVDEKPVEGSSVTELKWRPRVDGGMDADEQGEAVVLELAGRGTVYVLSMVMTDEGWNTGSIWTFQVPRAVGIKGGIHKEDLQKVEELLGRFPFIPGTNGTILPVMVAFKDEGEFRSVYRVLPEDFSRYFGAGVKFVSVEFEVTDEPVTDGVLAKRLPMLRQRPKEIPDAIDRGSDGNLVNYSKLPFEYKIGPKTFFSERRF
jgi:hypothetical protein